MTTSSELADKPETLARYREHVVAERNSGRSASWAKARLDKTRLFCEWLVANRYMRKLPLAIGRGWSKVGTDEPSPQYLTLTQVRKLWKLADDRLKLASALGLNCGYRAKDIQTLESSMIDLKAGVIRRQRSKTGAAQIHCLWKVTKDLLREHLENNSKPFAVGWSNISKELTALIAEAGIEDRTAKAMRSTGAQFIEQATGGKLPHVVDQYLAHTDKRTAKHYREQELEELFAAIRAVEIRLKL